MDRGLISTVHGRIHGMEEEPDGIRAQFGRRERSIGSERRVHSDAVAGGGRHQFSSAQPDAVDRFAPSAQVEPELAGFFRWPHRHGLIQWAADEMLRSAGRCPLTQLEKKEKGIDGLDFDWNNLRWGGVYLKYFSFVTLPAGQEHSSADVNQREDPGRVAGRHPISLASNSQTPNQSSSKRWYLNQCRERP